MWTTISNRFYLLPSLPLIYSASYCQTIGLKILLCDSNNLRICNPGIRGTARSNQSILKEINPEHSLEGLMLKLKLQYFGHLMQSWLIWKDPDAGKDWRQEEKRMTEDKMVGWHHRLDGHVQAPGAGDGQGSLPCCSPWGHKESDTTGRLNQTELSSSVPSF